MIKIVLASDSHSNIKALKDLYKQYPDYDYYWLAGDSTSTKESISPFVSVKGNNDYEDFPNYLNFNIEGFNILIIHGHLEHINMYNLETLVDLGKMYDYNLIIFGHLHRYIDIEKDGVRLLNPGSLEYNRDEYNTTFMLLELNDAQIKVQKVIKSIPR